MKIFSAAHKFPCVLACAMLLACPSLSAAPLYKSNPGLAVAQAHRMVDKRVIVRSAPVRTVTMASVYSLNALPRGHMRFMHNDETFYYSEGVYYQKRRQGFVVVKPRAGFRVAALPRGYSVLRQGRTTFYRFNNVRYRKVDGFFVVV